MLKVLENFLKDEKNTFLGLLFFLLIGLTIVSLLRNFAFLNPYIFHITISLITVVTAVWLDSRHIHVSSDKFTIGITNLDTTSLKEKDLEKERKINEILHDQICFYTVQFKDMESIGNQIEIIKLPKRIKVNAKNAEKSAKSLKTDLLIWGECYYDKNNFYFRPRFEFLHKGKFSKRLIRKLTNLNALSFSLERLNFRRKLSNIIKYSLHLGFLLFGYNLTKEGRFEEANIFLEYILHKSSFHDISPIAHFLYVKNFNEWGSYLLRERIHNIEELIRFKKSFKKPDFEHNFSPQSFGGDIEMFFDAQRENKLANDAREKILALVDMRKVQ